MRKILKRLALVFVFILLPGVLGVYWVTYKSDYFYHKFKAKTGSMIIGSSKAFYGIDPGILERQLEFAGNQQKILNYGFFMGVGSYGPNYLKMIQDKIDPRTRNGLFILEVDWTSLSTPQKDDNNTFQESGIEFNHLRIKNMSPNWEYLLRQPGDVKPLYDKVFAHFRRNYKIFKKTEIMDYAVIHENGWVSVPLKDSLIVEARNSLGQDVLRANGFPELAISEKRLDYLRKTIRSLQGYGQVVLVKMPESDELFNLMRDQSTAVDSLVFSISAEYSVPYINFSEQRSLYPTFDYLHFTEESAQRFTRALCDSLIAVDIIR